MKFVADLHLHSKYSRAVSQNMVLSKMAQWAKFKGIDLLATGDFTHPFWFDQLKNELEEAGNGLFRLRSTTDPEPKQHLRGELSFSSAHLGDEKNHEVYFLLSCEISSIYSQGGKGRRIHNLVFFPSLTSVEKFNTSLVKRGANLRSDGRPIVGLSSPELAHLALEADEKALVIPAHAWTPWFSLYGSFSGFDSIEECFGDMAQYIYGIETGLSSDPAMNWQIADLDTRAILSFSDAHSLEKMGREATVFEADEISYDSIYWAIANYGKLGRLRESEKPDVQKVRISDTLNHRNTESSEYSGNPRISFTIEFYPEEGKYHYTGHRNCNFSQSPRETEENGDICPVCKRKLTVGVMHRVEELKKRDTKQETRDINGVKWIFDQSNKRPPYVMMVPLAEIIAEVEGCAVKTKRVFDQYKLLVEAIGSEFNVLLKAPVGELRRFGSAKVVEGIEKVRCGSIEIEPGYDGEFGKVKIRGTDIMDEEIKSKQQSQLNLFA